MILKGQVNNKFFLLSVLGMLQVDPGHSKYPGNYYDQGQTRSIPQWLEGLKKLKLRN